MSKEAQAVQIERFNFECDDYGGESVERATQRHQIVSGMGAKPCPRSTRNQPGHASMNQKSLHRANSVPKPPDQAFTDADRIAKLERELSEYIQAEKVLIAAGLVSEAKVEQAHDIVRNFK